MLVDTHCHLFNEYYDNIDMIIENAINNGVNMIIVNGVNKETNHEVLDLVNKYDIVYGALGIQPEEANSFNEENIKFIEDHIDDDKIIAVGEIGLDYHYDCDRDLQKDFFKRQLRIAKEHNKPVIIHSRDCIKETYDILKMSGVFGIIHCYSGSVEMAREFTKIGFLIGIGGISTFHNASRLISVIKEIDLEYIVLETDSPYLTPEPYRGRRNEPANVSVILKKICELRDIDYDYGARVTTSNVFRLFDK